MHLLKNSRLITDEREERKERRKEGRVGPWVQLKSNYLHIYEVLDWDMKMGGFTPPLRKAEREAYAVI